MGPQLEWEDADNWGNFEQLAVEEISDLSASCESTFPELCIRAGSFPRPQGRGQGIILQSHEQLPFLLLPGVLAIPPGC